MRRITLTGDDLAGFSAPGPADHVKVFFPDPDTGELVVPSLGPGGARPPEPGTSISRDYTPLAFRAEGASGPELDLDFVLHGLEWPASEWAAGATSGDRLVVAGPRGSALAPVGVSDAVLVADETALPAVSRWLDAFAPEIPVTALLFAADAETAGYLPKDRQTFVRWITGPDREREVEAAVRTLTITPGTFVFLAGEAAAIAPLRRYLRRESGLAKEQVDAHGYWKRGVIALDHHAPLDPLDPD